MVQSVSLDYDEPQTGGFFVNGQPALAICVALETDAVVPDVGRAVDNHLQRVMQNVPAGLDMTKIYFQPDKVRGAIGGFAMNVVESVLIVILILILFVGWRSGLIVGFGLILTILMSFPILSAWGTTLQRMSLGAFIVAMGMLVDNAVVIIDGIMNDRKRRLSHHVYLYRTVHNTAWPLLAATLIAILAFIGVYLSKGTIAEYASAFRDFNLIVFVFKALKGTAKSAVRVFIYAKDLIFIGNKWVFVSGIRSSYYTCTYFKYSKPYGYEHCIVVAFCESIVDIPKYF